MRSQPRVCPRCSVRVSREQIRCDNGHRLKEVTPVERPPLPIEEESVLDAPDDNPPETKLCPFCAEEIKWAAIRCKHCQADLSSSIAEPHEAIPPERSVSGSRRVRGRADRTDPSTISGCTLPMLGGVLLVCGLASGIFYFAVFDSTVESDGIRVHNIGLMSDRTLGLILGVGISVIGVLLLLFGKRNNK